MALFTPPLQVLIPKFPAAFVDTGDLFTALSTAWLSKTQGNLKMSLERTIDTLQVATKIWHTG